MSGTTLHLARHGAHDLIGRVLCGTDHPITLNAAGARQAEALARRLATLDVKALLTSPARRCRETARVIGATAGTASTPDARLSEIGFGDWTDRSFDSLSEEGGWQAWNRDRARACPPGGESTAALMARTGDWLDQLRNIGGRIVAVTHADVIKAMVCHVLGLNLHFHDRLEVSPGSLTTLEIDGRGMTLTALNEIPS